MSKLMASRIGRWAAVAVALLASVQTAFAADEKLADDVKKLVAQMDDRDAAQREAAELALVELGAAAKDGGEEFFTLLPTPSDDMSQETATRLARIREVVQAKLGERVVVQSRVTLDFTDAPLADVLKEIEKQTGNRLVDGRETNGQDAPELKVTIKVADVPFWQALDEVLDQVNLAPYPYGGEEGGLSLVVRDQGVLRRAGRATYAGPFRIEPTRAAADRGLRNPDSSGLDVDLEVSWEPRLRPVALAQDAEDLEVKSDDELEIPATSEGELFNVEVPADATGAEVTLSLRLPAREAKNLKLLKGRMTALVPSRVADVRFENLADGAEQSREIGGATVTLKRVTQNQSLWEIHMRIAIDSQDGANVQRGWVFQNETYLEGPDGDRIEHGGFETTMQSDRETGFAYFFELPEGGDISEYTWIYRTPAGIVQLPVEYELADIPLP